MLSSNDICTIIGDSVLGSIARNMMRASLAPKDLAAVTYSISRSESVLALTTRAYGGMKTIDMASIALVSDGPR